MMMTVTVHIILLWHKHPTRHKITMSPIRHFTVNTHTLMHALHTCSLRLMSDEVVVYRSDVLLPRLSRRATQCPTRRALHHSCTAIWLLARVVARCCTVVRTDCSNSLVAHTVRRRRVIVAKYQYRAISDSVVDHSSMSVQRSRCS